MDKIMKTKIVYAVSSDEQDIYLEQTVLSVFSLKRHNPDAVVEFVVDERTDKTIAGKRELILQYVNKKIVVEVPESYDKKQTSRFLKTNLRQYIDGDFLFIDSDTVIADSLADIDSFDGDIGAVINEHVPISLYFDNYGKSVRRYAKEEGWQCNDTLPYFNSGVMFVRDSEMSRHFYKDWHNAWLDNICKFGRHYDQPPLALVNEKNNYVVTELPAIWNCQILRYGLPYLHQAKIIHYFAAMYNKDTIIYAFRKKAIYEDIKNKGYLSTDLIKLIDRAKTAFDNPTRLCTKEELNVLSGEMAMVCLYHPIILNTLNSLFRLLSRVHGWFIRPFRKN